MATPAQPRINKSFSDFDILQLSTMELHILTSSSTKLLPVSMNFCTIAS